MFGEVEDLLDESILAGEFIIHASDQKIDLTQFNSSDRILTRKLPIA
ncbi:hypothetical protein H6F89_31310 [Cyanobacteria bacterium FACHB-63]|nr:hypothetical protein [Cyanobacteria bacterium FACHB-63]